MFKGESHMNTVSDPPEEFEYCGEIGNRDGVSLCVPQDRNAEPGPNNTLCGKVTLDDVRDRLLKYLSESGYELTVTNVEDRNMTVFSLNGAEGHAVYTGGDIPQIDFYDPKGFMYERWENVAINLPNREFHPDTS
jgi:hypothetical protein